PTAPCLTLFPYTTLFRSSRLTADFHCVTTWSRLDNVWDGVLAKDVGALIRLKPEARYVLIHCDGGYTTNLSLDQFLDDDVIFARSEEHTSELQSRVDLVC